MFMTRSQQSRVRLEALEAWRAAAHVVAVRWDRFLHAAPEMRVFAFASYVAALDCEEAAAADLAAIARPAAAQESSAWTSTVYQPIGRMKRTDSRRSFHASNRERAHRAYLAAAHGEVRSLRQAVVSPYDAV